MTPRRFTLCIIIVILGIDINSVGEVGTGHREHFMGICDVINRLAFNANEMYLVLKWWWFYTIASAVGSY